MDDCACGHPRHWHDDLAQSYPPRNGLQCRLCAVCGRERYWHDGPGHDFKPCACKPAEEAA